jgi:DNA-binding NtrC family response regulator
VTSKRILLVDDEGSLRVTLAANLELDGFQVVEAESGERALELLRDGAFDLMLSDIRMPGISGAELFQRARKIHPEMPVVLMTAFALEEVVRGALREGVFAVVAKPFDVGHVSRMALRALAKPMVLVIDDREEEARSTAEALRALGLRAEAAGNGASALQHLLDAPIDVCIVDLVMPGMSGAALVEKLRAAHPDVTAIVVSGYAVPEMMNRAAAEGAFACLRKPVLPQDLAQVVAEARGRRDVR